MELHFQKKNQVPKFEQFCPVAEGPVGIVVFVVIFYSLYLLYAAGGSNWGQVNQQLAAMQQVALSQQRAVDPRVRGLYQQQHQQQQQQQQHRLPGPPLGNPLGTCHCSSHG